MKQLLNMYSQLCLPARLALILMTLSLILSLVYKFSGKTSDHTGKSPSWMGITIRLIIDFVIIFITQQLCMAGYTFWAWIFAFFPLVVYLIFLAIATGLFALKGIVSIFS